ncbi:restriction endonuclease subunit S [Enterobacter asburiae]|uniref:restriction endonuclease subunit S n=1 Tax=Enterobacter asburiae TaxID=61645 RepID=UPI001F0C5D19|nr:restriction endonuclease subunit S [Enterobacter asburiae]MCH4304267.1 restriction endonuclease subunit S [Enterobacter asburiae]
MSGGKLPEGWVKSELDNILLTIIGGGTPSKAIPEYYQGDIPWMSVKDMNKHTLTDTIDHITNDAVENSSTNIIPAGTPIIATRMSLGKIVTASFDSAINQDLKALFLSSGVDRNFFIHWYRSQAQLIESLGTGTTVKGIRLEVLKALSINLPPFFEQKNIAEKLDTLLAQVESIKARLEQIPQILKRFRQAVLIAAFTKKLTVSSEFTEKKISDICSFQNGFAFKSSWFSKTGSYQVIKLANIRDGYLFLENAPAYVNEEQGVEFSKFSPNIGDVLISMTGTRFKKDYGFGCIMTQKHKALINQRVGRLIPIKASILPEYLFLFVRSELFREQFFKGETGGVNQGNVGSQHIQSILINVPPLTEQHEIVRRVEQLFAYADTIEKQVNSALTRVNSLTQSILAKAFRGELTAQWRAENPDLISGENSAAALLEKIKAERAASGGKKTSRKKA